MCLTKSGESRKDCKGVAAQKNRKERTAPVIQSSLVWSSLV